MAMFKEEVDKMKSKFIVKCMYATMQYCYININTQYIILPKLCKFTAKFYLMMYKSIRLQTFKFN